MPNELAKRSPGNVTVSAAGPIIPAVLADAGEKAGKRFIEFLTATIRNANTRRHTPGRSAISSPGASGTA